MARRRLLTGRPLLVASAGVMIAAGCPKKAGPEIPPVGNLMAPVEQMGTVCVDVLPEGVLAQVVVNGVVATERCVEAPQQGSFHVVVSAPGYAEQEQHVPMAVPPPEIEVVLAPAPVSELPTEPPVGNLMAPQDRE